MEWLPLSLLMTDVTPGDIVTFVPAPLPSVLIFSEAIDVAQIVEAGIQAVPVGRSSNDTFVEMRLDIIAVLNTAVVTIGPGDGEAVIPCSLTQGSSVCIDFKIGFLITISTLDNSIVASIVSIVVGTIVAVFFALALSLTFSFSFLRPPFAVLAKIDIDEVIIFAVDIDQGIEVDKCVFVASFSIAGSEQSTEQATE
jgi:hypothetical protein